ncbi:hypothetical protein E3N88_36412 [Mikania micrantha]|uniref:Uncharacterized protein n=1 Tax=Mikania micrantha TaxID=192012 RepID=A0A5N6M462_9ASTR|nr:hypothetical protein E3N88_36412 [Mikania micrantha]
MGSANIIVLKVPSFSIGRGVLELGASRSIGRAVGGGGVIGRYFGGGGWHGSAVMRREEGIRSAEGREEATSRRYAKRGAKVKRLRSVDHVCKPLLQKRISSDEGMRRVRRRDAIETVAITTVALGFDCGGRRRRDATKGCEGFDCGGRRRRRWLEGASGGDRTNCSSPLSSDRMTRVRFWCSPTSFLFWCSTMDIGGGRWMTVDIGGGQLGFASGRRSGRKKG